VTGSGWISAGPGYRQWLFGDQALIEGSTAISWRMYRMAQARFELPALAHSRVTAGSQVLWHDFTQISYFGNGPASNEADRSEYRMRSADIVGYGSYRPTQWLAVGASFGWLGSPTIQEPGGTFKRGNPDARLVFGTDPVFARAEQPSFLHGDVSITADTRDARSYPTSGGLYRAAWANYTDRVNGAFSLRRYEAEAAQFVPLADRRLVFAMHGWLAATDTSSGSVVPVYLAPSLGGHNSLRGYSDYRFHDRNLLITTVEARLALTTHIDLATFVDAGNVAGRLTDLNLEKRDYGLGIRVNSRRTTYARVDLAHGAEGWRLFFRTSDPLHLSRLSRHTAAAPFVQ
jgi:hypothetical protein